MTFQLALFIIVTTLCILGVALFWFIRSEGEQEIRDSGPTCFGGYPKYSSQKMAERECWGCLFNEQCKQRTRYE